MCWFSNLCVKILCKMFQFLANKSYYHNFIAINFTKPSWRTLRNMIFSVTNPTDFVDWFETIHKMWSCSFWTLPHRGLSLKDLPPRNTPDLFCRRFTRQNHRCAAWAVFFFYGSCTLKISWADRTWYRLSVNAAAQTGAGTSFGANGDPPYMSSGTLYLFLRLNNSETFVKNTFWAQR